jgi:colanic acid/amylovoran biosynthesis glycosyltransferase
MTQNLVMVHSNTAKVESGVLNVDRKFHVGMLNYAKAIRSPLVTIHPANEGESIMDPVQIPITELPYQVMIIKMDRGARPLLTEVSRLEEVISKCKLVYGGGFGTQAMATRAGIGYISILEYDLQTQMTVATADIKNPVRRGIRLVRTARSYLGQVSVMRGAHSLHCNGYPIYDVAQRYNSNTLMYLDSRMSEEMVIPEGALEARLNGRKRPLKLLFSGRYERMKGTIDAVSVVAECLRRGLDVEMHFYGQGSLKAQMQRVASGFPGKIFIHDAIRYTELVRLSREFDLFVCCHIQSDPSCTYLESFGAGLPIVGYANRMWKRLQQASGAGRASPMGRPGAVCDDIAELIANPSSLDTMSRNAREFAIAHCYEREFAKRTDALNEAVAGLP